MAEFVQLNLENMIPELETMEKIKLFTQDGIRRIIRKRKEFEYKLQRGNKVKEDLLNYIHYEWDLLVVVKNKTLPTKSFNPKRNNVAYAITQRIQRLFTEALRRFGGDVKIWLSSIDFCTQLRLYPALSQCLEKMLELHQDKPELFCTAAQIELNILGSMDRARMIILNGIRLHKKSHLLYKEAFAMELSHVETLRAEYLDRNETPPDNDPVLKNRLAELIYESAIMNISSVELVADLFRIAKTFTFAKDLAWRLYTDIRDQYKDQELRWDVMARYKLENLPDGVTVKEAIKDCVGLYQEAVKALPTFAMWSFYIDAMLEINEDLTYLKNFKTNCLMQTFLEAHNAEKLKEEYYLKWALKLGGASDSEKKRDVLKSGTCRHPKSIELREKYLITLVSMQTSWEVVCKEFFSAVSELKKHKISSLPLWKCMILSYMTDPVKVEDLMKKGVFEEAEVSQYVRTMYLEWLVLSRGLKVGRKAYADYANKPPFALEFHKKMIELEESAGTTDVPRIRKYFENMVTQFGKDSADVWMDYVKFETEDGDAAEVPRLYAKAQSTLSPAQLENFVFLFSLFQIEQEVATESDDETSEPKKKTVKLAETPSEIVT